MGAKGHGAKAGAGDTKTKEIPEESARINQRARPDKNWWEGKTKIFSEWGVAKRYTLAFLLHFSITIFANF